MSVRSVLTVDVDDSKFRAFTNSFEKYSKLLAKTPEAWGQSAAAADRQTDSFKAMTAALLAQSDLIEKIGKNMASSAVSTEHQATSWQRIAREAKSFAGSMFDATRSILKWTGAATFLTGLVGAGSLFGLDRLAWAASNGLRNSQGRNVTFGKSQAFNTDFGRIVDSQSVLGGVNAAMHDLTLRPALYGAGLTEGDIAGRDTGQVAAQVIEKLKPLVDATPGSQLGQLLQARHLGQLGFSVEDLERLRATSPADLKNFEKQYATDRLGLDVQTKQLKAWQDLQVALTRAGKTIESTLITGLAPLAPELTKLSTGFTDVVSALLASPTLKTWIADVSTGMEHLSKFIGTPEFKHTVENLVSGIGDMATAIASFVEWAGGKGGKTITLPGGAGGDKPGVVGSPERDGPRAAGSVEWLWDWLSGKKSSAPTDAPAAVPESFRSLAAPPSPAIQDIVYRPSMGQGDLPSGLLSAVAATESNYNPNATNSRTGAAGEFQFMPGTWAQYGQGSPYDPQAATQAAGRYFRTLLREFHGDVGQALAGYNWGPGNVERDIRENGANWGSHLPAETRRYIDRILATLVQSAHRQQGVHVYDSTGGSVTLSNVQTAGA